ncbi:transposase [Streptomyces xanthophaeus]|nr:transposase [Streptomyces xanthophaeus]
MELSRTFGWVRKVYDLAVADMLRNHRPARSSVRERTCGSCGTTHDRDGNAAVGLLAAGPAAAACGAGVRPHRESSSRSGRSVAKQESPRASVGIPSR